MKRESSMRSEGGSLQGLCFGGLNEEVGAEELVRRLEEGLVKLEFARRRLTGRGVDL